MKLLVIILIGFIILLLSFIAWMVKDIFRDLPGGMLVTIRTERNKFLEAIKVNEIFDL